MVSICKRRQIGLTIRSSQRLRVSRRLLRFAPAAVAPRSAVAHLLGVRRT